MNSCRSGRGRGLAISLVLLIAVSCGRDALPDVPAFEQLGFADALDAVHRQVHAAYERWQEEPLDAGRNGRMGMLLSVYGKDNASVVFYRRARILAPDEFRWAYFLGIALRELGRHEEAAGIFREALEIDPEYLAVRIYLAGLLLQTNSIEESIELYRAITVESPERVEGWFGLGKALDRMGAHADALTALQRARLVGPQYGEVHYALALALSASGDKEGAARELAAHKRTAKNKIGTVDPLLREFVGLHAGDKPHLMSAFGAMQNGQYEDAVASLRTVLALNPANQNAWDALVFSQAALGDIDAAGATYRAALEAEISYPRLHFTYGKALWELQQLDAARDVMGKAIALHPQFSEALSAMGELEMQSGASTAAVEHFRRALAVIPNDRQVALSLAQALNASGQFREAATRLEPLSADAAADKSLALKELAIAYYGLDRKDAGIDALLRSRDVAEKSFDTAMVEAIDALLAQWQAK